MVLANPIHGPLRLKATGSRLAAKQKHTHSSTLRHYG